MPNHRRRYFMTATLAPRMNVDNGLRIFKYNGAGPVCSYSCSDLAHSCTWIPAPATGPGSFDNRPPSPNSRRVKVRHLTLNYNNSHCAVLMLHCSCCSFCSLPYATRAVSAEEFKAPMSSPIFHFTTYDHHSYYCPRVL
jgi:hypothetical protein